MNWGKHIAVRPVKRSVMPTESWSPMGGLGGESDQRQQRSCRTSCRSHLARGRVSELPLYLNSFFDFDPEKSSRKNLLLPAGSCQLEACHLAARAGQPPVGEVAAPLHRCVAALGFPADFAAVGSGCGVGVGGVGWAVGSAIRPPAAQRAAGVEMLVGSGGESTASPRRLKRASQLEKCRN